MSEIRLETQGLSRHFGALVAVTGIDFKLAAGARHALIGPNGAGKTTFINLLTGVLPPSRGRVLLGGKDITAKAQAERVKLGIARTFQINRLFRGLSVLENVCIPVAERIGAAPSMFYPAGKRTDVIDEAMHLLEVLRLADVARPPRIRIGLWPPAPGGAGDSHRAAARGAAARRARRRRAERREPHHPRRHRTVARSKSPC